MVVVGAPARVIRATASSSESTVLETRRVEAFVCAALDGLDDPEASAASPRNALRFAAICSRIDVLPGVPSAGILGVIVSIDALPLTTGLFVGVLRRETDEAAGRRRNGVVGMMVRPTLVTDAADAAVVPAAVLTVLLGPLPESSVARTFLPSHSPIAGIPEPSAYRVVRGVPGRPGVPTAGLAVG